MRQKLKANLKSSTKAPFKLICLKPGYHNRENRHRWPILCYQSEKCTCQV